MCCLPACHAARSFLACLIFVDPCKTRLALARALYTGCLCVSVFHCMCVCVFLPSGFMLVFFAQLSFWLLRLIRCCPLLRAPLPAWLLVCALCSVARLRVCVCASGTAGNTLRLRLGIFFFFVALRQRVLSRLGLLPGLLLLWVLLPGLLLPWPGSD